MARGGPVLVIGAGVSGLTCAVSLLEAGFDVVVWARELPADTVSSVAAAVWYPLRAERDERAERAERWLATSYERFTALARDPATGIVPRAGIELFRRPADDTWWRDVLPGYRRARADELPPGFADGFCAERIPVIEMPIYLAWLVERVRSLRGMILGRAIASLDEALAERPVVVNCSALGARELCADGSMLPVRGQVVRVAQFGLDRYVLDEGNPEGVTYVWPRRGDVVCGGTREPGESSLRSSEETARAILARCSALVPEIARAPVVSQGVGLRPGRPSVRLEAEERAGGLIVHDYGHGGSGVTLSWGCARDVVEIVSG